MAKKKENTTSIGFEDAIWRAADKLRGNLNASEYEGVFFVPHDARWSVISQAAHTPELESQMNTFDWLTLHYIWKGNARATRYSWINSNT